MVVVGDALAVFPGSHSVVASNIVGDISVAGNNSTFL